MSRIRLDRYLANAGCGTRKEVRSLIRGGLVTVGGTAICDPAFQMAGDLLNSIKLKGQSIRLKKHIHLLLNKPAGYVTALEDKRHPTVGDLIPEAYHFASLFPIGRLDLDATGLLILTNDGILCHRLASPRWGVWKIYDVLTAGKGFESADIDRFKLGITLEDGTICKPAKLEILGDDQARLAIHEGRFHQVKRMMLATGREVVRLHRQSLGPLDLDMKTAPGKCRELTLDEESKLYEAVDLVPDT